MPRTSFTAAGLAMTAVSWNQELPRSALAAILSLDTSVKFTSCHDIINRVELCCRERWR
jgi:hypothetical protein